MPEISAELLLGPYDGRSGRLTFKDEPPRQLMFSLADRDSKGLTLLANEIEDELTAVYVQIVEKPRKVITYDDNGRARSELGVRFKYDAENSPCERAFRRADEHALLTATAHDTIMETRRRLLEEAAQGKANA
jgi:hypothetical protein